MKLSSSIKAARLRASLLSIPSTASKKGALSRKERPDRQLPGLIREHVRVLEVLIDALAFAVREIFHFGA